MKHTMTMQAPDHSPPISCDAKQQVTPQELLFDLVFAFGVSQLSQHLWQHLGWQATLETVVMLVALLTVWIYTSWVATIVSPDRATTLLMMLAVMLLGLFLNASVTNAFSESGRAFVVPFLSIQIGRTVWTIFNVPTHVYREHYLRGLVWILASAPLWTVGAQTEPSARLWWWAAAAFLELLGTWLAHPVPGRKLRSENVPFDADHMLERCALFLLIAIGETVLTTGGAIASAALSWKTITSGVFAMLGTVALWSMTFGRSHYLVQQHLELTMDPVRTSRYAINSLMVMVAGLIAVAVGNEIVLGGTDQTTPTALALLLAVGPILFLSAQAWYLWALSKCFPQQHLTGIAILAAAGLFAPILPPTAALALVSLILGAMALVDRRSQPRQARRNRDDR